MRHTRVPIIALHSDEQAIRDGRIGVVVTIELDPPYVMLERVHNREMTYCGRNTKSMRVISDSHLAKKTINISDLVKHQ
ncbi:hypothetical protein BKG82_27855 [Mycobacteroides chelonae]|uniref:Uncharacterized protein n=1 Tax=Mycobacteroides chelonae TaxID=1774 RepID=A0A1S1LLE7_MYCCH|nr:hypothetical protein BKG82_27855 [Mycobacteroides chelonae]